MVQSTAATDLQAMENLLADAELLAAVLHYGCCRVLSDPTSSLTPTNSTTPSSSLTTIVVAIIVGIVVPLTTISIAV